MSGLTTSCRIRPNALGDWQILPPAGQITQIGDAGLTANGLISQDDFFVTGNMEVRDELYVTGVTTLFNDLWLEPAANLRMYGQHNESTRYARTSEQITIPVGQGLAGILSAGNMCPNHSVILGAVGRVIQAPGGGATLFDVGRNLVGPAEFANNVAVALNTTFTSPADGDGSNAGPVHNAADTKIKITTDANVTGTDMELRIAVFYMRMYPPES